MNDLLAEALGLTDTEVLVPTYSDPLKKLAVYVPKDYEEAVRTALGNAGAGHIGNYSHCAFSSEESAALSRWTGQNRLSDRQESWNSSMK